MVRIIRKRREPLSRWIEDNGAFRPAFRPCPARLSFIPTARHRRRDRGPKGRAGVGSKIREHRLHPLHRPGAVPDLG
jgi:hypothetical protein